MRRVSIVFFALLLALAPAAAQNIRDRFTDAADDAKIHDSGFVCPLKIGDFERDAVGEHDALTRADFCSYSAQGGVYGTVVLMPLAGAYDPKAALAPQVLEEEATGGKQVAEGTVQFGGRQVYTRTYETTSLEDLRYRTLFAAAPAGGWAVEATVEFATPRDDTLERGFLDFVYGAGAAKITVQPLAAAAAKQ